MKRKNPPVKLILEMVSKLCDAKARCQPWDIQEVAPALCGRG